MVDSMPQEINSEDFRTVVEYYVMLYAYIVYQIQIRLYSDRRTTFQDFMYIALLRGHIANMDINTLRSMFPLKQDRNLLTVDDHTPVD